jgi:AraC-like DNA-binding protein
VDLKDPWPPADALGEALYFLRMNGAYYCRCELSAPWGLTLPATPGYLWLHVVASGRGWLETDTGDARLLQSRISLSCPTGTDTPNEAHRGSPLPGSSTWTSNRSAVAEPAARLGYRSEAAFARAFKRGLGISPGAVKHVEQV